MKSVIFDLDNCLADDTRRLQLINWDEPDRNKRYEVYHYGCDKDPLANGEILARQRAICEHIIILTSRPNKFREKTMSWLQQHVVPFGWSKMTLLMRNNADNRPSVEVKKDLLLEFLAGPGLGCDIIVAFDDRKAIVEMYHNFKINGIQLQIHREEVYRRGSAAPQLALKSTDQPVTVASIMREAAATFEQRSALYKDNYHHFGKLMLLLFPGQKIPELVNERDAARLNLILDCLCKLQRYAYNFDTGGHKDSARDLSVYACMLEEMTDGK